MNNKVDSLVAAIEGNFGGMSHGDLVLTCEMLTRGRAAWRADAEKAVSELEALQKEVAELKTEANAEHSKAVELCDKLIEARKTIEELQKHAEHLQDTLDKKQVEINEPIMAVARKFQGETRHQTALRYIQEAEAEASSGTAMSAENK